MSDLVEWLTKILKEDTEAAYRTIYETEQERPTGDRSPEWRWVRLGHGGSISSFQRGAPSPQRMLADIAAKRAIIALHKHTTDPAGWIDCSTCGEQGRAPQDRAYAYCEHLRLFASAYKDRAGYREEWAVQ